MQCALGCRPDILIVNGRWLEEEAEVDDEEEGEEDEVDLDDQRFRRRRLHHLSQAHLLAGKGEGGGAYKQFVEGDPL